MKQRTTLLKVLTRHPLPYAGVLAIALAVVEVVVDWITWIELNEAIVYSLPLILAAAARSRKLLWGLTAFLGVTTFAVYYVQMPPGTFSFREPFFIDRVLAAVTLLISALLLHGLTLAIDAMAEDRARIARQNEELDAANRALLTLKEEITRQNMELDRRRQVAEELSSNKSRMLASVSHDIRSPLSAITLMAQVLRRSADDPETAAKVPYLAQRLQANALSAAELVAEVLDISSIDAGQVEVHESDFPLAELFDEQCRSLAPLAEDKGLSLTTDTSSVPFWIRADRLKLARVLGNLVSNSIKFTETGEVSLSAELENDGSLEIRVADTGVGIAKEHLERIFDEFTQLQDPNRDRKKGWGLGLAICRRLTEVIGGQIAVESAPGRGSVFSIRFPARCVVPPPADSEIQ